MDVSTRLPAAYWVHVPEQVAESSLWLRVGFIALSVFASALIVLIDGDAEPLKALPWMLAGAAATWWSFRRACVVANREPSGTKALSGIARAMTVAHVG